MPRRIYLSVKKFRIQVYFILRYKWLSFGSQRMNGWYSRAFELSIWQMRKRRNITILGHNFRSNFIPSTTTTLIVAMSRTRVRAQYEHLPHFREDMQSLLKKQGCQIEGSLVIWDSVMPVCRNERFISEPRKQWST